MLANPSLEPHTVICVVRGSPSLCFGSLLTISGFSRLLKSASFILRALEKRVSMDKGPIGVF